MLGTSKSIFGFDPRSVGGCQLWLDGADPAGSGVIPANGASVSTWADKSGNGNNATGGVSPTYNTSQKALTFNGSSWLTTPYSAVPTNETAFIVFQTTTTAVQVNAFMIGPSANGGRLIMSVNENDGFGLSFKIGAYFVANGSRISETQNQIYIGTTTVASTTSYVYLNGTQGASSTLTYSGSATTQIGTVTSGTSPYIGYIYEILMYNAVLTTGQRQAVEGYLSWKWGLETRATTSLPTSISSCVLWLDGADSTRTTNIATGTWLDKSGLGSNATSNAGGGAFSMGTMNGVSAVTFPTGSFGFTANTALASATGFSAFFVAQITTNGSLGSRFLSSAAGSYRAFASTTSTLPTQIATFVSPSNFSSNTSPSIAASTPFMYSSTVTSSQFNQWINGVQNAVAGTSATFTAASMFIGNFSTPSVGYAFRGQVGEVIIYSGALTTAQRQSVESYLSRKWKISVPTLILPQAHPFYSIQPFARYFNPIDVPGCQLWLDGADASTVTGTTSVTAWKDKSGNARDLGVGSGTTSYANGAITLATSYMFVNSAVNLTNFTFFIVVKSNSASINNQTIFIARPTTGFDYDSPDGLGLYVNYQNTGQFYGRNTTTQYVNLYAPTLASPTMFSFASGSTVINAWISGGSVTGASGLPSRTGTAQGFAIGAAWSGSVYNNIISTASIYELIVYNAALTTAQRQAVEGYLAWKWGLNASLPATGHSFSKFPASTAAQFNPVTVTGCLLWLDGADSNATANITTGVWYDKSGLSSTATSNAGGGAFSMGTINTVPAVAFPAASVARLTASTAISTATGFSVFMVASMSALASSRTYLLSESNSAYRVYASTTAFPAQVGTYVGAFFSSLTSPSLAVSTPFVYSATVGATQFNQWINGVVNTVTGTVTTFTGTTMNIGNYGAASSVYAFTGQMGEVIIYSGVVTTAQRQAVEGYLAWKWGLQTNLPTTHPFYKFAPGAVGY